MMLCSLPPEHTTGLHVLVPWWLVGPCDQLWPMSAEQKGLVALWSRNISLPGRDTAPLPNSSALFMVIGMFQMGLLQVVGSGGLQMCHEWGDLSQCQPLRLGDVCYCSITCLDLTNTLSQIL